MSAVSNKNSPNYFVFEGFVILTNTRRVRHVTALPSWRCQKDIWTLWMQINLATLHASSWNWSILRKLTIRFWKSTKFRDVGPSTRLVWVDSDHKRSTRFRCIQAVFSRGNFTPINGILPKLPLLVLGARSGESVPLITPRRKESVAFVTPKHR